MRSGETLQQQKPTLHTISHKMFAATRAGGNGVLAQKALKKEKTRKKKTSQVSKASNDPNFEKSYVMEQMQKQGFDDNQLNLKDIDKNRKMMEAMHAEADEHSDEEDDDDGEEEAAARKKKRKAKKAMPKKKSKYALDMDDDLVCHGRQGRPVYFEQYNQIVPLWNEMLVPTEPCVDLVYVNPILLQYVNEVMATWTPQNIAPTFPDALIELCRVTPLHTNFCFNPLQAVRAWTLLTNIAKGSTAANLSDFICTYSGVAGTEMSQFNADMLSLHLPAEEQFDGCVRLFTELPYHLKNNIRVRNETNAAYGGKSLRTAIQHHAFSTDSDGFYSCHRINQEMSLSTKGAIHSVVPETHAPNWRATMVLASAMDCTFYWKTDDDASETNEMLFKCPPYKPSCCAGIRATAKFKVRDGVYELESHREGVHLYVMNENPTLVNATKKVPKEMIDAVLKGSAGWADQKRKIFVPKGTTSTPLSLYKHAKENGLTRLFSSEKAELQELHSNDFAGHANFVTLFDHYHKTNFEIHAAPPSPLPKPRFDEFCPERAHQCVDEASAPLFQKFQKKVVSKDPEIQFRPLLTHYESHLSQASFSMHIVTDGMELEGGKADDVVFDKPFYYIMTRQILGQPIILCAGYFNNTIWVNNQTAANKNA